MPKLRWDEDGDAPDWDELDDAEYNEDGGNYAKYEGPQPPKDMMLSGEIKKVWATRSSAGNKMFKVLFEASGNTGEREKYNGLAVWENVVWTPSSKFKWQPFLDALEISLKAVQKATITGEQDDNVGTPVLRIHKREFPARVRIQTDSEMYNGSKRTKVAKWFPGADGDDEDDFEDDEVPF